MAALVEDRPVVIRPARPPVPGPLRGRSGRIGPPAGERSRQATGGRPVMATVAVVALLAMGGALVDAVAPVAGRREIPDPAGGPGVTLEGRLHLVRPGQTYWSIAEAVGGSGDIRERVHALQVANGGRMLRAGDRLVLPE